MNAFLKGVAAFVQQLPFYDEINTEIIPCIPN